MSLPYLYKRPETPDESRAWAWNHQAIHIDVNSAVFSQKSQQIPTYQLSPIDPQNMGMWLYEHQVMHNLTNAALGINGFDLLGLDFSDPESFPQWLQLHGDEHQRWNQLLGV